MPTQSGRLPTFVRPAYRNQRIKVRSRQVVQPRRCQRRSDLAKRFHREGTFGGRQPARKSAEVRARRASELAQQLVQENRTAMERTLREVLR
jgi:hypothetical protein